MKTKKNSPSNWLFSLLILSLVWTNPLIAENSSRKMLNFKNTMLLLGVISSVATFTLPPPTYSQRPFKQEFSYTSLHEKLNLLATGEGEPTDLFQDYLKDVEETTNLEIIPLQREHIFKSLKNNFSYISPENTKNHRKKFNKIKKQLILQWETMTKRDWPIYKKNILSKSGKIVREIGQYYDAHHIIEQSFNGPNTWWNIHPAKFPDEHQNIIHRVGGFAWRLFNQWEHTPQSA